MTWGDADNIDRTAKILIDAGKAANPEEAADYLRGLVLQVAVGPEIAADPAAQAALATAVNAGARAFRGGVHVTLEADPELGTGWTSGQIASAVVRRYGGSVVHDLNPDRPTLVIGEPARAAGEPLLRCTWRGWAGGIVRSAADALAGEANELAGILSAAFGVSEAFQRKIDFVEAGRRDVGLSLWRPDLDWRSADAGPSLEYLPSALWLLGLGHLGQAYAWALGMLPYAEPGDADLVLVDFDIAIDGNRATQLLVTSNDVGKRKTRIVAEALEGLGLRTRLVERAFDEHFRAMPHASLARNEPLTALAGFDGVGSRRALSGAGFRHIVDGGLGSGPLEYRTMDIHAFPAFGEPASAFPRGARTARALGDVYEREIARRVAAGDDETDARCGMLEIAGVTVGAAFVGTIAGALVVADILRLLHDGASYALITLDLRRPSGIKVIAPDQPLEADFPPYTRAR